MKSSTHNTGYEYGVLALICMSFGVVALGRWLIMPLLPQIMREFDLDYRYVNVLTGVYTFAYGFSLLVTGPLSDWFGRKKLLIGTLLVLSLLSGLIGLARSFPALLALQFVTGAVAGVLVPIGIAVASETCASTRRGLNLGLLLGMFPLGLYFAPVITLLLPGGIASWRWAFAVPAISGLIIAGLMMVVISSGFHTGRRSNANVNDAGENNAGNARVNADAHAQPHPVHWFAYLCSRNVWLAVLAGGCTTTAITSIGITAPIYLIDTLHLNLRSVRFAMLAMALGSFCGFLIPTLSDYLGRRSMAVTSFVISALLVYAFRMTGPNPLLLCVLLFAIAFFVYGILALMVGPIAVEDVPPGVIASAVGLVLGSSQFFRGIAEIATGVARYLGFGTVFWFILCALVPGVVISFFLVETAPRKKQPARSTRASSTE